MTEIIISVAVLISALSIRDAILHEISTNKTLKSFSTVTLALFVLFVSVVVILLFMYPVRKFFLGDYAPKSSLYDKFFDITIGIVVLVSALSLRDASTVFFEQNRRKNNRTKEDDIEDRLHWKWAAFVSCLTVILILLILYDNNRSSD